MHFIDNITSEGVVQQKSSSIEVLSTNTSAGTLALTVNSEFHQFFTGSTVGLVVTMPVATTLVIGYRYQFNNDSTVDVTIKDGNNGALFTLPANFRATIVCTGIGSAAGTWSYFITSKTPPTIGAFLPHKSGTTSTFIGNPLKATISFGTPFATSGYSVSINGTTDSRTWLVESRTASGFVINSQSKTALTDGVLWIAMINDK